MTTTALSLPIFTQLLAKKGIAPVENFPEQPCLLFSTPPDIEDRAKIRFLLGQYVRFERGAADQVARLIKHWRAKLSPELDGAGDGGRADQLDNEYLKDLASDAPVIRMVNHLMERALDLNASDIHFEPEEKYLMVRCRVDGVMVNIERLPANVQAAVSSRVKLMARLDIGEKRLPQDGRIQYQMGERTLDMRVSTLPGVHGESIVLRLLDRSDISVSLDKLGMPADILKPFAHVIQQPHGMILVTGPTGSGKTTTLYGTLEKINTGSQKIITIEDPVEYQLEGITQIHVNAKIGLTFAAGLRSIVRQDPDIIMVGEIRDHETAEIAIESALTGHLVFSTLHTNDAAGAITRLQDMGVDTYLISSSVMAIMAQRLVRKICQNCAEDHELTEDEAELLGISRADHPIIKRGHGCERCANTGYRGRLGLYELLIISDSVRAVITSGGDANKIREQAQREGLRLLRQDALEKLYQGITTPEEIVRVTRAI
ncbi:type II secretory pathway, ATPase PulE/Tfp pilus assembly pathway, ATPase PilB [Beggiatoa alba B18LD]|uniref:Type II secretory pathway, ATPase PulE/Tfp pilus assembly pathway, ATPase PilB n=1 Tax=Beggiatoa alba B18LD TaxID=395493 RepID=I3CIA2_9GAMM|nr:ATPase, T2SS/T4P/T4SS family [Beggiatoa alba]EIJ43345.1 type II secretory pathway, ATPase PulE/Tfp pilus assembly pathway, ATPase PilB [Beggiatoa alba B18LD]